MAGINPFNMSQILLVLLLALGNPSMRCLGSQCDQLVLKTGWYLISDTATPIKRNLENSASYYFLEERPIVSAGQIKSNTILHEKDCYALISRLDSEGAIQLRNAKTKFKGKKLGLIVNDKLLRIQKIDDPQFCRVALDEDPRVYGEVLTFPCNSRKLAELVQIKSGM